MNFLGLNITRTRKDAVPTGLRPADNRGGWFPIISESFAGAWQNGVEVNRDTVLAYSAVYACITLIASDISKMCLRLVQRDKDGIWSEFESPSFSPVLRKPNHFQTRIKFIEQWMVSKLAHGNTYVLKQRDNRNVVVALYILDPTRVKPLVAPDGAVFYQIAQDNLSGVEAASITVPAREIIHDVMVPMFHPLVGVSPIYACGLAAVQGLKIQNNSARFFGNGARPSGILSAPAHINDDTARRLKEHWETNYTGENTGKVAVLGDGLSFVGMTMSSVDAQLIEQLKWSAETVCSCFHVPTYMVGVGPAPNYNNVQALTQQYYAQALQNNVESIEACLDDGLGLDGRTAGTEFDLDDLLRMDTATKTKAVADAVQGGFMKPNEARKKFDMTPVDGGDTPYLQVQNYSLAALAKRDAGDPFAKPTPTTPATTPADAPAATPPAKAWTADEHVDVLKCVTNKAAILEVFDNDRS